MIAQIVFFSRKTDAQRKKNFAFRSAKFAQKFWNENPIPNQTRIGNVCMRMNLYKTVVEFIEFCKFLSENQ